MRRATIPSFPGLRPALALPFLCLVWLACADGGRKIVEPAVNPRAGPEIVRLIPERTVRADTVRIEGSGFGGSAAGGETTFAGESGRAAAEALAWTDTAIEVLVPPGASTGPVIVRAGDQEGSGRMFSVAPALISYAGDLLPLLNHNGCVDCHSGDSATNNLRLESAAGLLRGDSSHGPVVRWRDGPGSIIVRKVSPDPPFGERMPVGCAGACLSDDEILSISDWIDQGARDN